MCENGSKVENVNFVKEPFSKVLACFFFYLVILESERGGEGGKTKRERERGKEREQFPAFLLTGE